MKVGKISAKRDDPCGRAVGVAGGARVSGMRDATGALQTLGPSGRRPRLMGASALAAGALRGLLLASGLGAAVPMLAPSEAAAQFICSDIAGSGQGATATSALSVACGPN